MVEHDPGGGSAVSGDLVVSSPIPTAVLLRAAIIFIAGSGGHGSEHRGKREDHREQSPSHGHASFLSKHSQRGSLRFVSGPGPVQMPSRPSRAVSQGKQSGLGPGRN
jgi:hypothetical protein